MRAIITNSLRRLGFDDVVEAADGVEALAAFDASIDFVVTDWNMPNMNGPDFVRAVRSGTIRPNVPILMVTARSAREDIIEAARAGVTNYIVKPFTPQVLKSKIELILGAGV